MPTIVAGSYPSRLSEGEAQLHDPLGVDDQEDVGAVGERGRSGIHEINHRPPRLLD